MKKMILLVLLFAVQAVATVSDDESIRQYFVCNGETTTFTFTFKCNSSDDVLVYNHIIATGDEGDPLTEDTDYTIAATGGSYLNGGVITISPALESTSRVVIVRNIKKSQETSSGAMSAAAAVLALDKLTRVVQDLEDRNDRSWHLQESDGTGFNMEIPGLEERAESYPYFGDDGALTYVVGVTPDDTPVSSFMETVLNDDSAVLAMATLQGIPVINVKNSDYGAAGDGDGSGGGTDDTAAIVAAIVAANGAGGGIVHFPPGTYNVTGDIAILSNVTLKADNATIFLLGSSDDNIFTISTADNIIIDGLEINGNGGNQGADNNTFFLDGTCDNIIIKNCHIHDMRDSVWVPRGDLTNWKFIDNWVEETTGNAIFFSGAFDTNNTLIARNTFNDTWKAIHYDRTGSSIGHTNVKIINNTFKDMGLTTPSFAIEIQDSTNVDICNNTIDTSWRGIGVIHEGAGHVLVANNVISNVLELAIESASVNEDGSLLIDGNLISNCERGISTGGNEEIGQSFNISVVNNILMNASQSSSQGAIAFWDVTRGVVSNNNIYIDDADSRGGIELKLAFGDQLEDIVCIGNNIVFSDTTRTVPPLGIRVNGRADRIKIANNLISVGDDNDTTAFIHLDSAATKNDVEITNNTIIYRGGSQSSNYGIEVNSTASTNILIKDNTITNTTIAIRTELNTDEPVTITDNVFHDNTLNIQAGSIAHVDQQHTISVELTAANIKALNGTPIELVAAQGGDTLIEFISAILIYDSTATAFDGVHNDEDLVIEYEDGDDISQEIEVTGFLDQTNDEIRRVDNLATATPSTDDLYDNVNDALQLYMKTGEITTGTGTMTVKITYRVHILGL